MTFDQLMPTVEQLERMTDAELELHFAPCLKVTRPEYGKRTDNPPPKSMKEKEGMKLRTTAQRADEMLLKLEALEKEGKI